MADWCNNYLTVAGAPEALVAFAEKARVHPEDAVDSWHGMRLLKTAQFADAGDISYVCSCCRERLTFDEWFELHAKKPLTFQAFVPQPPGLDESAENRWRLLNWNTLREPKFEGRNGGFMTTYLKVKSRRLEYKFASAASPPIAVIQAMCEQHPELGFKFRYRASWSGEAGELACPTGAAGLACSK